MKPQRALTAADHRKELAKLLASCGYRHDRHQVFSDFLELAALATANAVDLVQFEAREARYLRILERYNAEEVQLFPKMLGELVLALECEPHDAMGMLFGELEMGNAARGQFFTPYEICRLMADLTIDPVGIQQHIDTTGFITLQEPAVGAGAMVIAFAMAMEQHGFNYQRHLHVTATDVDARAVHMAYLQFSLMHIPATVVLGNTLTLETREVFYTPAHILGGWSRRLQARDLEREAPTVVLPSLPDQLPLFAAEAA